MEPDYNEAPTQDDRRPDQVIRVIEDPDKPARDLSAERRLKADEFIQKARRWWKLSADGEMLQRERSLEEVRFNSGGHFEETDREARLDQDKVVIEVNRTPQYLNQVGNEQRMTKPTILVRPTGNGDINTAQVKQDIIRCIEKRGHAEAIRDDGFYGVLEKGWSHWRVNIEWAGPRSFKKIIRPARIYNDFSVYTDPAAVEPDRSDAMFRFITEDITFEEHERRWPGSERASGSQFTALGDDMKEWIGEKVIRVAELHYKDITKEKLFALADDPTGDGKWEDELERDAVGNYVGVALDLGKPVWRWNWRTKIMFALIDAFEVLSGSEDKTEGFEPVPGAKYIPIITALGRRILIRNKYIHTGMVRDAMAPCLASDYWLSQLTEMVALGPKAPWIVAWESVKQHQDMWDQANIVNFGALYYDHVDANGQTMPAPFRNFGEAPIQAMTFILKFADEDLKRVMGIYNAGLGAQGPESSGVAINSRKEQSDVANYNYQDNFKRAIEFESKIYIDYIPKVMSVPQLVEIVRPDGSPENVWINKEYERNGEKVKYMMSDEYATEVEIGPSFNTKRQEAAAIMQEFVKNDPESAPLVADLIADNMDFPNKTEFVKRLKSRVPANLLSEDGQPKIPPQFQAQYDAQAKQLETVTQLVQQLQEQIKSENAKYQHERDMKAMELSTVRDTKSADVDVRKLIAEMNVNSKATTEMVKAALEQVRLDVESLKSEKPTGGNPGSKPLTGEEK